MNKKILLLAILSVFIFSSISVTGAEALCLVVKAHHITLTSDLRIVNMYRYYNTCGKKDVPIVMVPGWTENHLIYEPEAWIMGRSFARYLAEDQRDVWVIDLRTHDTDGDPGTAAENEENMWKYWDFDETYVKKDMVAAMNYIKWWTGKDSVVLSGHSMGGLISLAYAELVGQDDLAGVMTFASPAYPLPVPPEFVLLRALYCTSDGHVRLLAPVNFDPNNEFIMKLMLADMATYDEGDATEWWMVWDYIGTLNDEPAGVNCDIWWGMDADLHEHWLDPDGHDYTAHLADITVPFLSIGGWQDEMALPDAVTPLCEEDGVGSSDKTCLMYNDYGHVDIFMGKNAKAEIFPDIKNWLNARFS